jgi:hypothetical protein
MDLWKDELSDEETDELIEKAAYEIRKRKLEVPATLFFEMHKPLAFVGSQAAIVFSPFLVPFLGFEKINNYSRVLAKRDSVEKLIRRLEEGPEPERTDD